MLVGLLPESCSRLAIFLSYASEHRRIAEELAQTLKNSGHTVFFDKDSLPPGDDYNEQIRAAMRAADRFVFLVSRSSMEEGRFTLTELQFAKERWPAPANRVFPVLLDKTIQPEELPAYLRTVQAISVQGNATAEIAHQIDKTRRLRPGVWASALIALLAIGGAALALTRMPSTQVEVAFNPPAKVDFRPLVPPPEAGGQPDAWLKSDVALTAIRFGYEHLSASGANAQLRDELVELKIDGQAVPFEYRYEVNIQPRCPEGGWHCPREAKPMRTLAPGVNMDFQSMFRAVGGRLSWEAFIDRLLAAKQGVSIAFTARMNLDRGTGQLVATQRRHECVLDLAKLQSDIGETRQKRGRVPIILAPACTYR